MMSIKLLLIESVTAGAFDRPLPAGLLPEAEGMLGAMVAEALACAPPDPGSCGDLVAYRAVIPRVLRRAGLPRRWPHLEQLVADGAWSAVWCDALSWADAVWLVAPETGGELEALSREVESAGVRLLGCSSDAVAVAASKSATHAALAGRVLQPADIGPRDGWVCKPDDGVAAEGVRRWFAAAGSGPGDQPPAPPPGCIVQPFVAGEAISLCLLSDVHAVRVLSVNRQRIEWRTDGTARYRGGVTNEIADRARFAPLATAVHRAIPGLQGCWGIDCVLPEGGGPTRGDPVLIEVNPRLTTAFVQLRAATGFDLLAALLAPAAGDPLPEPPAGRPVAFELPEPLA
jgi:predicted ATP-grasp superfamily ATP-dependent carboligase